jgi:hypothetical protein
MPSSAAGLSLYPTTAGGYEALCEILLVVADALTPFVY